jgi:hypothetical protein
MSKKQKTNKILSANQRSPSTMSLGTLPPLISSRSSSYCTLVPADDVCELSNLLQIHDKEIEHSERQLLSLQASISSQEERHASEVQSYHRKLGKLEALESKAHSVKQNSDLGYAKVLKLREELKEEEKLDALNTIYNEMKEDFAVIQRSCDETTAKVIELTPAIDEIARKYCLEELKQKLEVEEKEQRMCEENLLEEKKKLQIIEEKLNKLEILLRNNDAESLQREIIQYRSQVESDSATIDSTIAAIDEESKRFMQYENSLKHQLEEMEAKQARLQSDRDVVLNLTYDLENVISKHEGSSAAAASIINAHSNQENELKAESARVSEALKVTEEDIHKLQCEISSMKSEETSVQSRLERAEFAINSFVEKRSIEAMLTSTSLELDELTQSCENVESQIQLLRDTGLQGHAPSTFLQLNKDLEDANQRLNGIMEEIKEKERQNAALVQVESDLTVQSDELHSSNKTLLAAMVDMQKQLVASHKEVSELRRKICQQYSVDEGSLTGKGLVQNIASVTASLENIKEKCEFHDQLVSELKNEVEKLAKQRDDTYINLQKITQKNEESYNREMRIKAEADVQLKISRAKEMIAEQKSRMVEQMHAEVAQADQIFQQEHLEAISDIATKKQLLMHTLEKLKSEESVKKRMKPETATISRSRSYDYSAASQGGRKQSHENLVNINVFDAVTSDLSEIAVTEAPPKAKVAASGIRKYTSSSHASKDSAERKDPRSRPAPQVVEQSASSKRLNPRPLQGQLTSATPAPRPLQTQPTSTTPATPATGYRKLAVSKNVALTDIMKRK